MRKRILLFCVAAVIFAGIVMLAACGKAAEETADSGYTLDNIRNYVVGIDEEMELANGGKKVVTNFDNAATTPALQPVMDEVDEELKKYGSIGRGFSPNCHKAMALQRDAAHSAQTRMCGDCTACRMKRSTALQNAPI